MRVTRTAPFAVLVLAISLVPASVRAVTPQEIVRLSKAGVSDEVILALIEHDRTIFDLTSDQILALKRDGVSETVVLAMLRSGPLEPAAAPTAVPAGAAAEIDPVPGYPAAYVAPNAVPYVAPYIVPYPVAVISSRTHATLPETLSATKATSPPMFVAPLPVANTLGPVSARGMFFTNPGGAAGMWFTNRPSAPESGRAQVPR